MDVLITILTVVLAAIMTIAYFRQRTRNYEDRYMALYGADDWESCNMELCLSFEQDKDAEVKNAFFTRLSEYLDQLTPFGSLFHEQGCPRGNGVDYIYTPGLTTSELMAPRKGIYFNLDIPGQLNVIWNHIQSDGVRLWRSIKPLFDANAAILEFNNTSMPPAIVPELLSFPSTLWRLRLRSNVSIAKDSSLNCGYRLWETNPIKEIKNNNQISFNIVASAMLLAELFRRHPEYRRLTVGITVAFTFLESKNQYGVITLRIKRGSFHEICDQIARRTRHPILVWGSFSVQSYLLYLTPDQLFKKLMTYFRSQIDVLISSLPCGRNPAEIDGIPIKLSCHPKELTIPYYFLLMGTGPHIHLSYTSKFDQDNRFMDQAAILQDIGPAASFRQSSKPDA